MRLPTRLSESLVLLLLGLATSQVSAGCPYAAQLDARGKDEMPQPGQPKPRQLSERGQAVEGKKGVFFMNRIGPSASTLYVANADGTDERPLLPTNSSVFEFQAAFTPDGKSITYTSEQVDGNSDLYMVNLDGTNITQLVASPSFENDAVLSPDATKLAYVSTANGYITNIWVKDLATGEAMNLTNTADTAGEGTDISPDGHFRPSWSPDGEWIIFSSDRNTDWTGHDNGTGWEHTQELSVYAIKPDGTGFKQVVTKSGYSLGQPKFSPDGARVAFYEITRENTYNAHRSSGINTTSSAIVSVDFATGTDRIVHANDTTGVRFSPQWVTNTTLGYLVKGVTTEGLNYTAYDADHQQWISSIRNPSWSPDGKQVVYERTGWDIRPLEKTMYSWQSDYEYRFMDVFPQLSLTGRLAYTAKQTGNATSNIITSTPDGTDLALVFDSFSTGESNATIVASGLAGSFQPTWSPDEEWIAFGLGSWFFERAEATAYLYRATANGSLAEQLTDGTYNAGFPSYSPDGRYLVYRAWDFADGPLGLKVMDLADKSVRNLTSGWDNTPGWSPDGEKIVFTCQTNWTAAYGGRWYADRFDICTVSPDGSDLQVLTTSGANDAHAVWTADNRIMWNSGMYGFRDECAAYDDTFQPYGQIMIMDKDGSNKTMLTDSMWEDSMPLYVPNEFLE